MQQAHRSNVDVTAEAVRNGKGGPRQEMASPGPRQLGQGTTLEAPMEGHTRQPHERFPPKVGGNSSPQRETNEPRWSPNGSTRER